MAKRDRGFTGMDREQQRRIASLGGLAAHKKGVAHEWTSEEAKIAGSKGGLSRTKSWTLFTPSGTVIDIVRATSAERAISKAPNPFNNMLGVYAVEVE